MNSGERINGSKQEKSSDVTPKIKLTAVPEPEKPVDNTIAPEPLPDTGTHTFIILGFITLICLSLFLGYKSKKIK